MNFDFLIELHKGCKRQGPGSEQTTQQALSLSGLKERNTPATVADIGCGTGASTLVLAKELNAEITAVDLFPEFLSVLHENAVAENLDKKINTHTGSMDDLPFEKGRLDAIWSEGAIYLMGFEKGIHYFKDFLKSDGVLAVSEISWLTEERPKEIEDFWNSAYAEMTTASEKLAVLEKAGFKVLGYFPLSKECWQENYYIPLLKRMDQFLERHQTEEARNFIDEEKQEISLYEKFSNYYSYGFYIAQKCEE